MYVAIIKTKNFLKMRLHRKSRSYRILRKFYRMLLWPFERRRYMNRTDQNGRFDDEAELHMCALLPRDTLDVVIKSMSPTSWLDAGCGIGAALGYVLAQGIDACGLEFSDLAINKSSVRERILKCDLTIPIDLGRRFDVVWCYEVAEHLDSRFADVLVDNLTRHGNCVILSAARPGQGGDGHINEREPEYWIQKMEERGFTLDEQMTNAVHCLEELYSRNVLCFRKVRANG